MASASSSALGRRRGNTKETQSEDQALNMIAREAEARLAAKRAARAEARSIRMKEIERQQKKEANGAEKSIDYEVDDATSLKRSNTVMGSSKGPPYYVPETSTNNSNDAMLSEIKTAKEAQAKYTKAMMDAAQLDNERQALQYQVEILKDIIEDLQQKIENTDDELAHKCKEYNKLSREHNNTSKELNKCMLFLEDRERILDEHGINLDGSLKEGFQSAVSSSSYTCSHCKGSMENSEVIDDHRDRGSLLAEIASLKLEIAGLKNDDAESARREVEQTKTERGELERSFVDVSSEAAVIREDARHTGLYVNNNEKCDEFEVIDNGSQNGGIRNFEDKSFEKSGSSMASSMITSSAMTSTESETPLDVSVDVSKRAQRDDYDIVQVEDPTKSTNFHLNSYASVECARQSGDFSTNINVDKYLFCDSDEHRNDDSEQSGTFSLDRYVAVYTNSTESEKNVEESKIEYYLEDEEGKGNGDHNEDEENEFEKSEDTVKNVQSDYDTIEANDVSLCADDNDPDGNAIDENAESPYEDVLVEPLEVTVTRAGSVEIIDELHTSGSGPSVDPSGLSLNEDIDIHSTNLVSECAVQHSGDPVLECMSSNQLQLSLDESNVNEPVFNLSDIAPPTISQSVGERTEGSADVVLATDSEITTCETEFPVSLVESEKGLQKQEVEEIRTSGVDSTRVDLSASEVHESEDSTLGFVGDASLNTAFCSENDEQLKSPSFIEGDKNSLREDVENLYNQIAGDTSKSLNEDNRESDSVEQETGKTEKGWLVQVESFTAPEAKSQEMAVEEKEAREETATTPEPKERKKKKKRHKGEKIDRVTVADLPVQHPVPSDPLLLGFGSEPDLTRTSPTFTEKAAARKSEIPKQFLDASHDLVADSLSDNSDVEDELGEEGAKKKGSWRSKKEGCKSQ